MTNEIIKWFESLGIGLSRMLRYSYGGFLLFIFLYVFEPHYMSGVLKSVSPILILIFMGISGIVIYVFHRSLIIPIHHMILCWIFRGLEKLRKVESKYSCSPTHWLGNILKVKKWQRFYAYAIIRRSDIFEKEKNEWNLSHAENGLLIMTSWSMLLASIYAMIFKNGISPYYFGGFSFLFFAASFPKAIEQHSIECLKIREKKPEIIELLNEAGFKIVSTCE